MSYKTVIIMANFLLIKTRTFITECCNLNLKAPTTLRNNCSRQPNPLFQEFKYDVRESRLR